MLRIAEREHYDVLFSNYKGNLKKSWILLKEVINRNKLETALLNFNLTASALLTNQKQQTDLILIS